MTVGSVSLDSSGRRTTSKYIHVKRSSRSDPASRRGAATSTELTYRPTSRQRQFSDGGRELVVLSAIEQLYLGLDRVDPCLPDFRWPKSRANRWPSFSRCTKALKS